MKIRDAEDISHETNGFTELSGVTQSVALREIIGQFRGLNKMHMDDCGLPPKSAMTFMPVEVNSDFSFFRSFLVHTFL